MSKDQLVPLINATIMDSGITLQQECASSHTANLVQEWCKKMAGFLTKELWPPSSPDLHPMDINRIKFRCLEYPGEQWLLVLSSKCDVIK